ncbi:putative metalloprotease NDAI_0K01620 [Naumovozyma dairenensis CBS 421]|uniref:Mitochondrial inner membrane protease ATP23 n=1 Tax=Naumovozyma dairenensis (strain ATCC 10597 / BCRC 20456 / CBS 421 / NBRC 0211 / NRRL Y-12639) TaxID=1071378 RepID=G0WHU2_NAUDC|nr:hypothetical protein NDAI_0K01620 [Naumovozyma dairenensis CBS 421]CCD27353.1 hypothetical protein NDAI_0K01620 [Naumovozyma dairenensis CBS 421]
MSKEDKGIEWWRRTFQYKTGLGLTSELKAQYESDYSTILNKKQCIQCYKDRDWMLSYSPMIRFMTQRIKQISKDDDLKFDEKIICDVCDNTKSGGYHPDFGILLCQNRLRDKWHLEDTLSHELIHWYDQLKWEVDWLNLKHHACSEIRASNLSGECRFWQEFKRRGGFTFKIAKGQQECVKRRAILSVMGNPNCKDKEHAERIVEEVWESCFNDTRPFEQIYK